MNAKSKKVKKKKKKVQFRLDSNPNYEAFMEIYAFLSTKQEAK